MAACFVLLLVLGQWRDALYGFSALGNSLIGIVQEYRAKQYLDRLAILHAAQSRVIRDGSTRLVPAEALVPDDIVLLSAGEQVATSEIGSGLDKVLRVITWLLLPTAVLVTHAQVQNAGGWEAAFSSGQWIPAAVGLVASIMSMIPLGLVLLTSVAFAVGGVRLAGHLVLVQELGAVKILARVDVLCLDKTGTLSSGAMTFDAVHDAGAPPAEGWRKALEWFGAKEEASTTAKSIGDAFPRPTFCPKRHPCRSLRP